MFHYFLAKISILPPSNTPKLFRGSVGTFFLSIPLFAFLAITVLGFIYTNSGWYFIASWVAVIILFAPRPKQPSTTVAFDVLAEAEAWFHSNGIASDSVRFNIYDGELARTPNATIMIGVGMQTGRNERIGFALEVVEGQGVMSSELITPSGIASQHRTLAAYAQNSRRPLLDVFLTATSSHRGTYGSSSG